MTHWCPDCTRSRRVLQRSGVSFQEIDIEGVAGAEAAMRDANGGSGKVPTLILENGDERLALIEPTDRELNEALRKMQASVEFFDNNLERRA